MTFFLFIAMLMRMSDAVIEIERIAAEIRACTACRLCKGRIQAVPGVGSWASKVCFIGEGPGAKEDELGEPFVGAAGKFLDKLLASIGWSRADVFITNAVKCRPPNNRDPEPDEKAACRHFLDAQLEILKPMLIVTLGRHAMYNFLPSTLKISDVHGKPKRVVDPTTGVPKHVIYPLYHPAAALYNPAQITVLQQDFLRIPTVLKEVERVT